MDEESVSNVTEIPLFEDGIVPEQTESAIIYEGILLIFGLIALIANCAIMRTIFRFKKTLEPSYVLLANWAIADLLANVCMVGKITLFLNDLWLPRKMACFIFEISVNCHTLEVIFVVITAFDWFLKIHFEKASTKFRGKFNYILGFVWIFFLVYCPLCGVGCNKFSYLFEIYNEIVLAVTGLLAILIFISIRLFKLCAKAAKRSNKSTLVINLVGVFVCVNVVSILIMLSTENVPYYLPRYLKLILTCLIFSSSITNLTFLYNCDDNFKACFRQSLSCSSIKYAESISELETLSINGPISDKST